MRLTPRILSLGLALPVLTSFCHPPSGPQDGSELPEPRLSGHLPLSVNPPEDATPEEARPWFDTFSWQSFIALNWPADEYLRGEPADPDDPRKFRDPPPGTPTVWSTYKEAFELFGQGSRRPTEWNSFGVAQDPCGDEPDTGKLLVMANKGGTLLDGANEAFSFPLIDQNKNYAYTEVRFDRAQYDFVRGVDGDESTWLYILRNLADRQREGAIQMPASTPAGKDGEAVQGAVMLKATWREMLKDEPRDRYYVVKARVYDPESRSCSTKDMGLVGFHIAHKLKEFPEWIWSSFEQVDNVARGRGALPTTPISFNSGTPNPATVGGFANRPDGPIPPMVPYGQRIPVQVTRHNPIPNTPAGRSTQDLNQVYQELLGGTVWEYYELVITQWPTEPENFKTMAAGGIYPQDCGQAFPVDGCTNTVMETYFQSKSDAAGAGGNSCMSCHYQAGSSDFSWVLQGRAHD